MDSSQYIPLTTRKAATRALFRPFTGATWRRLSFPRHPNPARHRASLGAPGRSWGGSLQ